MSKNNNKAISKDDIFGYINQLTERIEFLESELAKAEANKNSEEMLLKMLKTSEKALNDAAEQIAAAQRRNGTAIKVLEDHIAEKTEKPAEIVSAKQPVEENKADPTDIKIEDNGVEVKSAVSDDSDDGLELGDIFNLFKN